MRASAVYKLSILATTLVVLIVGERARRWFERNIKKTETLEEDEPVGYYPRNEIIWGLAKSVFTFFGRLNWQLGNFELIGIENIEKALKLGVGIVYAFDHRSSADVFISQLLLWLAGFKHLAEEVFMYVIGLRFFNRHEFLSLVIRGGPRIAIVQPGMTPIRYPPGSSDAVKEEWRRQAEIARRVIKAAREWVHRFLDEGRWIFISLEGTRSEGPMVEAAPAAASLINNDSAYVLPVALEKTEIMWPKSARFPLPFAKIRVIVGELVSVKDLKVRAQSLNSQFNVNQDKAFVDLIMRAIALLHIRQGNPWYAGYYAKPLGELYTKREE